MTERVLCILNHPSGAEKTATVGHLCRAHREQLDTWLDETFEMLAAGPLPDDEAGDRARTKKPFWPAPIDLAWLAIHDPRNHVAMASGDIPDVRGELSEWLAQCDEEHGKRGNGNPFTSLPLHHDWIAAQDWLGDYRDCLRRCHQAARLVTRQPSVLLPKAVSCPVTLDGEDCGGRMRRHERGLLCVKCRRLWQSTDLLRLGLLIDTA